MPSVVAQNCAPRPWAERHAARGDDSIDGLPVYLFAVRPSFCFCPGTGRRGACGSPSAEPPARLREAGGITPGRFGPFMPVGAPAGADATGVSGAIGTAATAKGSSKKEARAMAPEPQPRSRASLGFRAETRVGVGCPAAGDGAMGGESTDLCHGCPGLRSGRVPRS